VNLVEDFLLDCIHAKHAGITSDQNVLWKELLSAIFAKEEKLLAALTKLQGNKK
jgi:hypothetical protein